MKAKAGKALKQAHTPNTKFGMGDSYGTGVKQKIGKALSNTASVASIPKAKIKKPPKSLA